MKRRVVLVFSLFYLFVYALSSILMDFYLLFEKYSLMSMPLSQWQYLLLDFMKSIMDRFSTTLVNWSPYKMILWVGTGILILCGAWAAGGTVGRAYNGVYSRLGEMEGGHYSGIAREKWIFSSLFQRLDSFSARLEEEQNRMRRQRQEERADAAKALDEIQALVAAIKGHAEVLTDTPSIPEDGYEKQLVQQILQKVHEVERVTARVGENMKYHTQREEEKNDRRSQMQTL